MIPTKHNPLGYPNKVPSFKISVANVPADTPLDLSEWFSTTKVQNQTVEYDFTVDWGDGTNIEHYDLDNLSSLGHTYSASGDYEIIIAGKVYYLSGSELNSSTSKLRYYITKVEPIYGRPVKFIASLFRKCTNLTDFCADFLKTTQLAYNNALHFTYNTCSNLPGIPPVDLFYCFPDATSVADIFNDCKKLEGIPLGFFDKQTNLKYVYRLLWGCQKVPQLDKDIFRNNPKITGFNSFCQYTAFTEPPHKDLFYYQRNTTGLELGNCWAWAGTKYIDSFPVDIFNWTKGNIYYDVWSGNTSSAIKRVGFNLYDAVGKKQYSNGGFISTGQTPSLQELYLFNCNNLTLLSENIIPELPDRTAKSPRGIIRFLKSDEHPEYASCYDTMPDDLVQACSDRGWDVVYTRE